MNLKLSWRTVYAADPFQNNYEWQIEDKQLNDRCDEDPPIAKSKALGSRFKKCISKKERPGKYERLIDKEDGIQPKPRRGWKKLSFNLKVKKKILEWRLAKASGQ